MDLSGSWGRLQRASGRGERVADDALLDALRKGSQFFDARARVKRWTRERFALGAGDAIAISEIEATLPGCPPLETVIEFRTADGLRHHFKVFKPLAAVAPEDLPPGWMKDALAMPDGIECDCC
jgi:nitrate reductase delta subunit